MNLYLNRTHISRYGMDGQILINHQQVCDTVEHPTHLLPRGTYRITIRTHPKLHRKMPFISRPETLAPTENGPVIGIGNGPFRYTDGSILVGTNALRGVVLHSARTFARLIDRLDKAQNRGETITLTIL